METNKELDYSRINELIVKVQECINGLPNDLNDENGITILLLINDLQNKVNGKYTLLNKEDERLSLVTLLDNCLGRAFNKEVKDAAREIEIFNSIAEYMMIICAKFPHLYDLFCEGVKKYKENQNNED